jgi:hypothetical protein
MPKKHSTLQDDIAEDIIPDANEGKVESYSVVLESIRTEIETMDSFALKFSVLLKIPVTRVKHMVKHLPCALWKGTSASKARMLVELAGEAGGVARIVENLEAPSAEKEDKEEKTAGKSVCSKCGFPLKKEDEYCNFCMTPVNASSARRNAPTVIEKSPQIPAARLFFYLVLLLIVVIFAFVLH